MPSKKQRLNLIEEPTTHKNDYKFRPVNPAKSCKFANRQRSEPETKPPPPADQIDTQTHTSYDPDHYVPFDLFIEPRPIIDRNPWKKFDPPNPRTAISGTRTNHSKPVISPGISLDEIEDEQVLKTILNRVYAKSHALFYDGSALPVQKPPNPPNGVIIEENVKFTPNLYPPLPPGWLTAAKHWDSLQSRNLGDPFKTFWTRKGPEVKCGCCFNPFLNLLPQEIKDRIGELVCGHRLRLPYDVTKAGYQGYRQKVGKGVPLERKEGLNFDS